MDLGFFISGRRAEKLIRTCIRAINHYGKEHQVGKAMEEMSELKLELERRLDNRTDAHRICGEIADVVFTVLQLAMIFGVDEVMDKLYYKVRRLDERIDNELNIQQDENNDKLRRMSLRRTCKKGES